MNYVDTSVIVSGLTERHPFHSVCAPLLANGAVTSTHALAESFAVLTGVFKYPNHVVSTALARLAGIIDVEEITRDDYLQVLRQARARGITGGLIYDALHAQVARRLRAEKILTYNVSNFEHVAADLVIVKP